MEEDGGPSKKQPSTHSSGGGVSILETNDKEEEEEEDCEEEDDDDDDDDTIVLTEDVTFELEDPETGEPIRKVVTFELGEEYTDFDEQEEDALTRSMRPGTASVIIGTAILFAITYCVIVLINTNLTTLQDLLISLFCALIGLASYYIMKWCAERARRKRIRRTKRRHSLRMKAVKTEPHPSSSSSSSASPSSHITPLLNGGGRPRPSGTTTKVSFE